MGHSVSGTRQHRHQAISVYPDTTNHVDCRIIGREYSIIVNDEVQEYILTARRHLRRSVVLLNGDPENETILRAMHEWAVTEYADILDSLHYSRDDWDSDWHDHAGLCFLLHSYEDIIGQIERHYEHLKSRDDWQ